MMLGMTPAPLTARQQEVLDFIRTYRTGRGYSPTVREVSAGFGMKSVRGAHDHLHALRKKGHVTWDEGKARSLRLLVDEAPGAAPAPPLRGVDVFARVHASGFLVAADKVRTAWVGSGPIATAHFGLVVTGEALWPNYQIGDELFFRRKNPAAHGELVLVVVGDVVLCRRFEVVGDLVHLLPYNAAVAPLLIRRTDWKPEAVLAVAIGMLRRYEPTESSAPERVDASA